MRWSIRRPPLPTGGRWGIAARTAERMDRRLVLAVAGLAVAVAAWPDRITAVSGLDPSWRAALHLAAADHLSWGRDLVFTYGPLGFLTVPWPVYGPTSILAIIASGLLFIGLSIAVVVILGRSLPLPGAVLAGFVIVRSIAIVLPPAEQGLVVAFIVAVEIVRRGHLSTAIVVGLGVAAGLAALVKLSLAVPVIVFAGLVVLAVVRRGRAVVLGAGAAALAFGVAWLVTGQDPAAIGSYLHGAVEIIAGYNAAMTRPLGVDRQWQLGALAIVWAVVVVGAWLLGRDLPRARRIALGGIVAVLVFVEWKLALRPFPTYVAATAAGALVPFAAAIRARGSAMATGLAVLLAAVVTIGAAGTPIQSFVSPVRSARTAALSAWAAVRVDRISARAQATRTSARRAIDLPPEVLAAITGHSTHVDPFETDVLMAWPEIPWRPLPVFQAYTAYTAALDQLNADFLASDRAPDRILREYYDVPHMTIQGRFRWFESPAANLAMLCHYRELVVAAHWEVLERGPSRCGPPVALGTVTSGPGEPIAVPPAPAGSIVVVHVSGMDGGLSDHLRTLLLRAQDWYARRDDGTAYRLVVDTARNGLLLGVPAGVDLSGPFGYGPPARTITIGRGPGTPRGGPPLTYAFSAIPVHPS